MEGDSLKRKQLALPRKSCHRLLEKNLVYKRALYIRKSTLYIHKRAMFLALAPAQVVPQTPRKEPCIQKSPAYPHKSPIYPQKSHVLSPRSRASRVTDSLKRKQQVTLKAIHEVTPSCTWWNVLREMTSSKSVLHSGCRTYSRILNVFYIGLYLRRCKALLLMICRAFSRMYRALL